MARAGHNAFAENLLRDLTLDVVHEAELATRYLTLLRVLALLRPIRGVRKAHPSAAGMTRIVPE